MLTTGTQKEDPFIGRTMGDGRYRLVSKLGEGGIGAVYKGIMTRLDQVVAVKVLRQEVSSDPLVVERFRNEAKIYARIASPYVVTIHDFGQDPEDGTLYLVMEYLPGVDLRGFLVERGNVLPIPLALSLGIQTLKGLSAAHALGIVHRDIKPGNIMILEPDTESPLPQVLDFGISKIGGSPLVQPGATSPAEIRRAFKQGLTIPGLITGTPAYMSPEQCRGEALDARADLYSFGVMLFEMLTGQLPFEAASPLALMMAHVLQEPETITSVRPDLDFPESLERAVTRAMARSPSDRFQSCEEFADALAAIGEEVSAPQVVSLLEAGERYEAEEMAIPVSHRSMGADKTAQAEADALVEDLLPKLGKAYRSFALYPRDNPIFATAAEETSRMLDAYFEVHDRLDLSVDRFSIYYKKKRVYEDLDPRQSYPFKLFSDGIRRLFFHHGLTRQEMLDYLDCLHKASTTSALTSDLVTLMWEKRFEHIKYHLVEDLIEDSMPEVGEIVERLAQSDRDYRGTERVGGESRDDGGVFESGAESLSADERSAIEALVRTEAESDNMGEFVVALMAILDRATNEREALAVIRILGDVLDALLVLSDTRRALMILIPARAIREKGQSGVLAAEFDALFGTAGSPANLDRMLERLVEVDDPREHQRIARYLTLLDPEVVGRLLPRVHELQGDAVAAMQLALLTLCKGRPDRLQPGLDASRDVTAAFTVRVLAEIDAPAVLEMVRPMTAHPSPDVRIAAVDALRRRQDPEIAGPLEKLTNDPSAAVRLKAIAAWADAAPDAGGAALGKLIEDPRLVDRPHDEQALVFRVLSEIGGEEVVQALTRRIRSFASGWRANLPAMSAALAGASLAIGVLVYVLGLAFALFLWGCAIGLIYFSGTELNVVRRQRSVELIEPAVIALVRIGSPQAREALREAAETGEEMRKMVERVLGMQEKVG